MTVHYIKTKKEYFEAVQKGDKTFELRKDDRNYQVGDTLMLIMLDKDGKETDEILKVNVTYVLKDCPEYGLKPGYAILGIKKSCQLISAKSIDDGFGITYAGKAIPVALKGSVEDGEH